MTTARNARKLGARLLLASSLAIFAATASHGNALRSGPEPARSGAAVSQQAGTELRIQGSTDPELLRCQSERCRNRQHRRIMRANCRLDGGTPSLDGQTCTIPAPGVD